VKITVEGETEEVVALLWETVKRRHRTKTDIVTIKRAQENIRRIYEKHFSPSNKIQGEHGLVAPSSK